MRKIWQVALLELELLQKQKIFLILAVLVPLLYSALFCAVYWKKQIKDLSFMVIDKDHSALSRQIIQAFNASPGFKLEGYGEDPRDFVAWARKNRAHLALVFPQHLERDLKAHRGGKVLFLVDASSILVGNVAINQASEILNYFSAGVEFKSLGISSAYAKPLLEPIHAEYRVWYNPAFNYNYANYLLFGMVAIGVQLPALLLLALSGDYREEEEELKKLLAIEPGWLQLALGKTLMYLALMFPLGLLALTTPFLVLQVPFRGSVPLFAGWFFWFLLILDLAGLGLSLLLRDGLMTTEAFAIIAMPAFLLSGYTWPILAIPGAFRFLSYALPLTPLLFGLQKISLEGAGPGDLAWAAGIMAVWSVLAVFSVYLGGDKFLQAGNRK